MASRAGPIRITAAAVLLAAAACATPRPRPLAFGAEECAHCHMTLADPRHAGQLVTTTGKILPFDDVGCLATFIATGGIAGDAIHSVWLHDFAQPDSLLDLKAAVFLQDDSIRTPMDYGLVALRRGAAADSLAAATGGRLLSWNDVLERVRIRPAR
ncbi:MAG TPA: nitrous oxide reductase accessory protein NosL [Gemmatimonadales bacterium]|nr:nitrous oxide reductase accessory protein NosL [Gemmatimonadales bacterium]